MKSKKPESWSDIQDDGCSRGNGVFWCLFVVFLLAAGIACWQIYGEVTGGLHSFGAKGISGAEMAQLKEATDKSVKRNDDMIAKGREAQKTAIPDSEASTEFNSLVSSSNMVAINKDFSSDISEEECTKQYERLKKLDSYTDKMSTVITRMEDEKRSKPLADAKASLTGIQKQLTTFLAGLSDDSLPSDKQSLKSDLNNLLGQVDTALQSDNITKVDELINKLNSKKKEIQDAQAEKSESDAQAASDADAQKEAQDALNKTYSSFREEVQALQNIPSIKSKGLKYVCELAGGEYEGTDSQGECYEK